MKVRTNISVDYVLAIGCLLLFSGLDMLFGFGVACSVVGGVLIIAGAAKAMLNYLESTWSDDV